MLDKIILGIKNNSVYQELNAYYGQSTVFSALGIERNENRQGACSLRFFQPLVADAERKDKLG